MQPMGAGGHRVSSRAKRVQVISLFPEATDDSFDPAEAVRGETRTPTAGHPWVMTNMIASADGATAVDGVSGALGGPADREMFMALRGAADALLVGASTVRHERYRPPSGGTDDQRGARMARGQAARPLLVVVTASLSLDPELPLFGEPGYRPLIITVESAPTSRRQALGEVADIVIAGDHQVDLRTALDQISGRGLDIVLAEGGPSLNGQLIAEDLVDEWNLSLSPLLAGGSSKRPATGAELVPPGRTMTLSRVWQQDQVLFCRWVRSRSA